MAEWIDKPEPLQALVATLGKQSVLALDTEFERVRTYWPKLALLQVNPPEPAALIDTLAPLDWLPLGTLLAEAPLLVMHSASEDLIALRTLWPKPPTRLFDTQIAASLVGVGHSLSYQKLVGQMLGIDLPKGETRSDWVRRPLSAAQLEYAVDDVRYLGEVHAALTDRLVSLGRLDWVLQEGARMLAQAADDTVATNLHHDYRNAWQLTEAAQHRLDHLLAWRERTARELDRPRTWILDNGTAYRLAESPPATLQALGAAVAQDRAFPKARANAVFNLLTETRVPRAGFMPAPKAADKADEIRFKSLRTRIDALAGELGIDPGALVSRRLLEARLRDGTWPADVAPWRRELLEPIVLGAA
jgi:ribonuclease D